MLLFFCANCKYEGNPSELIIKPWISNGVEYPGFESKYCPKCKCSGVDIKEVFSYEEHVNR